MPFFFGLFFFQDDFEMRSHICTVGLAITCVVAESEVPGLLGSVGTANPQDAVIVVE